MWSSISFDQATVFDALAADTACSVCGWFHTVLLVAHGVTVLKAPRIEPAPFESCRSLAAWRTTKKMGSVVMALPLGKGRLVTLLLVTHRSSSVFLALVAETPFPAHDQHLTARFVASWNATVFATLAFDAACPEGSESLAALDVANGVATMAIALPFGADRLGAIRLATQRIASVFLALAVDASCHEHDRRLAARRVTYRIATVRGTLALGTTQPERNRTRASLDVAQRVTAVRGALSKEPACFVISIRLAALFVTDGDGVVLALGHCTKQCLFLFVFAPYVYIIYSASMGVYLYIHSRKCVCVCVCVCVYRQHLSYPCVYIYLVAGVLVTKSTKNHGRGGVGVIPRTTKNPSIAFLVELPFRRLTT